MDDILYIVLGVAWLAWSLYSNKLKMDKKRAEQTQRDAEARRNVSRPTEVTVSEPVSYEPVKPKPARPGRSILEEIFSEYTEMAEAEQEVYQPEVDEKSWQQKMTDYNKSEAQSLEEIKEEISADYFSNLYSRPYNPVEQQVISITKAETDYDENTTLPDDFDLKKAVLYSEILRAPYISGAR